jgi:hypothetical protein
MRPSLPLLPTSSLFKSYVFANIVDVTSKDSEPRCVHNPRGMFSAGLSKHPGSLSHRVSDTTSDNIGLAR